MGGGGDHVFGGDRAVLLEMGGKVLVQVHRNEGGELHEAGIDAPAGAAVAPGDDADHFLLEPGDGLGFGEDVDAGGVAARVDGAGHQGHGAGGGGVALVGHDGDGGEHGDGGLADADDVAARAQNFEEVDDVLDIFVEAEGAG